MINPLKREAARFECLLEPFGTWLVWDRFEARPAVDASDPDLILVGLSEEAARRHCARLNAAASAPPTAPKQAHPQSPSSFRPALCTDGAKR